MMRLWRLYISIWLLGALITVFIGNTEPFTWLGIQQVDVFNKPSLQAAEYRISYFRDTQLLPFMSPAGESLRWFLNEDFKYRTYFISAYQLSFVQGDTKAGFLATWNSLQRRFLRPALYDFCRRGFPRQNYSVVIQRPLTTGLRVNFILERNKMGPELLAACDRSAKRWSLLDADAPVYAIPEGLIPVDVDISWDKLGPPKR